MKTYYNNAHGITPTLIAAIRANVIQYPNIHDAINGRAMDAATGRNNVFYNQCTIDCDKRNARNRHQ